MEPSHAADMVLVVDLDGTLIRTDMLYECFWASFASDWRTPLHAARALMQGRAALKRRLARAACPAPEDLPYDLHVVDYVRDWQARGGRTALVTASDQEVADRIAAHLECFDEVHGSDGNSNLKGAAKAEFVAGRFGDGRYAYIGDSAADLPVWDRAGQAITVRANAGLKAQVAHVADRVEHISPPSGQLMPAIEAMRPHQWLKNILVFLPVIAGHAFSPETLGRAVLAFLAFGLVASSVYVLNDLFDLSADRAHPRKHRRPFASGRLPIAHGTWLLSVLLLGGLVIATALGGQFVLVMLGYFTATTLYSLWLKRQIVVDICILAGLYTLRIVAGSVATGIPLSVWLLAFGMFFFFALAAVKRQAELVGARDQNKEPENGNRRGYRIEDMPLVAQMATASGYVSVLVMALYLQSPEVQAQYTWPGLLWGVCLILLYWISRMVMLAHRGRMYDDPVLFAATDRVSLLAGALIAMLVAAAALL